MTFIIYFNIIPKKENIVCDILSPKKNSVSAQLNHYSQLTWKPRFTMYYMDAHIPSTQLFIPIPQRLYSFSSLRALSLHLHKSAHCLFSWYRTQNCKTPRLGKFDPCLTVSLVASIVFPQALFWYTYPIIIMISFWYSWLFYVLGSFLFWLQNLLASIPVINIIIRAQLTWSWSYWMAPTTAEARFRGWSSRCYWIYRGLTSYSWVSPILVFPCFNSLFCSTLIYFLCFSFLFRTFSIHLYLLLGLAE